MIPKYLLLKGFRSYLNTHIDFTKFGDICCLIGDNGNGKSSIIEGITTCLFWRNNCTDNKGAGMDSVINTEVAEMELEYAFEMNGVNYVINTKKQRGQSRTLDFYIDGVNQSEKVTETQQKINDVIKMNYDTFLDTVCIGQGQASRFMNKKPSERKETLMQILDVKKYEEYEKVAKERKKSLKAEIDNINTKLELLIDKNFSVVDSEHQIEDLEHENELLKIQVDNINAEIEKVLSEKSQYEASKKQRDYILNTRKELINNIDVLKRKIEKNKEYISNNPPDTTDYTKEIQNIDNNIYEVKDKIANVKSDISSLNTKNDLLEKQQFHYKNKYIKLRDYNEGECELCGQLITNTSKTVHLSEWKTKVQEYQDEMDGIVVKIDKLKQLGGELVAEGKKLTDVKNELQQKISEQSRNTRMLDTVRQDNASKIASLSDKEMQLQENLQLVVVDIEDKVFNDRELKYELTDVQNQINNNCSKIAVIKNNIVNYQNKLAEAEVLKTEMLKIKEEYSDYTSLATAFGKNGIPAQIIEHDIPELEFEVNNILSLLSNNSLSVKFITSKNSAKKTIDTFEVIVNDINGSRTYETYSGGEKFRVDFACHIGLSKFLTKRSGASIDFLMIDEGLGSQDDNAKQKFIESINALKGIFKQIMVITHIQDLQNSFVNKVIVQKDQLKGSYVEII